MTLDSLGEKALVRVQLSFEVRRDRSVVVEVAREWFEQAWTVLGADLQSLARGLEPGDGFTTGDAPLGVHRGAAIVHDPAPGAEGRELVADDEGWAEILRELPQLPSVYLEASANTMLGEGKYATVASGTYTDTALYLVVQLRRYVDGGFDVAHLVVEARSELLFGSVERELRTVTFMRQMAAAAPALYGDVSYGWGAGDTGVESGLGRFWPVTLLEAGSVLRGYSWITVVPETLAGQVADSGAGEAFVRMEQLPGGGLWLQATERFRDYDSAAAARVFDALRRWLPENAFASAFRTREEMLRP